MHFLASCQKINNLAIRSFLAIPYVFESSRIQGSNTELIHPASKASLNPVIKIHPHFLCCEVN
jgi:hypothetical protein